jgi:prephenate dehydrogenase
MPALAQAMLPCLDAGAIVTDAGSVKTSVVRDLDPILGARFLGSHPIAGSERTGIDAARKDLFAGATCVLTPLPSTPPGAVERVSRLWRSAGCEIVPMTPETHDAALARTSHLPHAAASALVTVIANAVPDWPRLAGGGFRDATRIAAGSPDLWTGILLANAAQTASSIAELIEILQKIRTLLEAGDATAIRNWLASAQASRQRLTSDPHGI